MCINKRRRRRSGVALELKTTTMLSVPSEQSSAATGASTVEESDSQRIKYVKLVTQKLWLLREVDSLENAYRMNARPDV